jgi:phosphoglycolate phosphatase-like HAD superfamily hydrolase
MFIGRLADGWRRRKMTEEGLKMQPYRGRWTKMMERQAKFQRLVYGPINHLNDVDRTVITKDLLLHLMSEMDEVLRELSWKAKRRQTSHFVRSNVLEEIVDMLKFVMSIAIIWGFTPEAIFAAFMNKSEVVEQRYRQEYPLYEIIKTGAKVVALDIDGVLSNWPYCFYDFIARFHYKEWRAMETASINEGTQNPFDALPVDPITIRRWKDEYRQSGFKRELNTIPEAVEFTKALHALGYKVVLVTARPYHQYSRIFSDTLYWLQDNQFRYDAIMWAENKEERLMEEFDPAQIALFVDDDPTNVDRVRACGVRAALMARPYNEGGITFEEMLGVLNES